MNPFRSFQGKAVINSLRFKFIIAVLLFMIPLICMIWIQSYYSFQVVRNQVTQSNKNMLTMYMNGIDKKLADVDKYLFQVSEANTDLLKLQSSRLLGEWAYTLSKISLFRELSKEIEYHDIIGVFFIYSEPNDDALLVGRSQFGETFEIRDNIRMEIRNFLTYSDLRGIDSSKWNVWRSEYGEYYLYRLMRTEAVFVGAWVKADTILQPLHLLELGDEGEALLVDHNMEPMQLTDKMRGEGINLSYTKEHGTYLLSGDHHAYLVMGEASQIGHFHLVALIPESAVLEKLPVIRRISQMMTLIVIVLFMIYAVYIRKVFLLPIQRIILAMRKLKDGNWSSYIKTNSSSSEFRVMNDTFNTMIDEIGNLKIHMYEEKLNVQKAELKHLQLQINPHFFLNSLNIIYNLATVREYSLIQQMAKSLVDYFRFMFNSRSYYVTLQEELEHTRNYLRIQELRFPEHLTFHIAVVDELLPSSIPPLMIQHIVENSIKYAVDLDEMLQISIMVKSVTRDEEPYMLIRVVDSGKGFPQDILKQLQGEVPGPTYEGSYIGIWNMRHRLRLLYESKANIQFANDPSSGAVVELLLPVQYKEESKLVSNIAR